MKPSPTNHTKSSFLSSVLRAIGLAAALALLPGSFQAADWTNNGPSNDWNTDANWSGGVVPNGEAAYITSTTGNIATISADASTITELQVGTWFNTGRLDHTAGSLSITNTNWPYGWLLLGGGTNGNGTYNIANTAASGGTFTGFGTGSGSLSVNGEMRVGAGAWWDHATGVLNVNTSGTVQINGSLVAGSNIGDVGTVNLDAGTVTVGGDYANSGQFGHGGSAATGNLNISGGSISFNNRLALAVGTGSSTGGNIATVTMTGGTLTTDAAHDEDWHAGVNMASGYDTATGGTATFNLNGGTLSTLRVFSETLGTGVKGTSTFNFNGGTLKAQASRGNFMEGLTRANVRNGGAVVDTNGFDVTISQALLHSDIGGDNATDGGLTKNGVGVLTMSAQHTFTGAVTVNAGTLYANAGNAPTDRSFSYASGITVNNGGTLRASVNSLFGWDGSQAKPITINAGGTAIAESEDQNVGLVTLNGGTLASSGAIGDWGSWNFGRATDKKLLVTDNSTVSALEVGFHNGATIEVASGKNLNFTGTITDSNDGASAVIKTSTGTLTLASANTYSGGTTVNAGTLLVNGSISGTTTVNGGVLGGTGTTGAVTVNDAGAVGAGNSIGTLTTGALTLNDTAEFQLEINIASDGHSATTDRVNATTLSLDTDNTAVLTLTNLGSDVALTLGTVLTFINYDDGGWNGGTFAGYADDSTFSMFGNDFKISYNGVDDATSAITLLVVPEPGAAVSLLGSLGMLLGLQRFRRRARREA